MHITKIIFKVVLTFIILNISFQSLTTANDSISDFQIEGMSIGDSALDYFTETVILKNNIDQGTERKFNRVLILSVKDDQYRSIVKKLRMYDGMHIYIDPKDSDYKIHGIEAMLNFENKISKCISKKSKIEIELEELFKDSKKKSQTINHPGDSTNKSIVYETVLAIDPKSKFFELRLQCFDWSKKMGHIDHLRIAILSDDVNEDINNLYK